MSKQKESFIFLNARRTLLTMLLFAFSTFIHAQTVKVSGYVYDESKVPLPGVSVLVEGTNKGTVTDFDGNFSLDAPAGSVLKFSYLGYVSQAIKVEQSRSLEVLLKEDIASLGEVVIVGYGTQKKESVVGAITQLDGEALVQRGTLPNLADALSGAIPGVTVLTGSGIPGGQVGDNYKDSQIFIRGRSTWNDPSPLVMVDGVERTLNDIDPETVKTISILKDASATAVYGVRGGNGVILVTTKRGATGDAQFKVDANVTFKGLSKIPKVLDGVESSIAKNRAIVNQLSLFPSDWDDYTTEEEIELIRNQQLPFAYPNRDWASEMLNDYAISTKMNLSVSGGTDFLKYYGSLGILSDGDILNTTDVGQGYDPDFKYDRFNYRTNLDFQLSKTTKLGVSIDGYYGKQQRSGAPIFNFWYGIYSKPWIHPVLQYEDGVYGQGTQFDRLGENEFVELNFNGIDISNRGELNSLIKLDQDLDFITKGLTIGGEVSYNTNYQTSGGGIQDEGVVLKTVLPAFYTQNDPNANIEDFTTFIYPAGFTTTTHGFEYLRSPLIYENEIINQAAAERNSNRLLYRVRLNYNRSFGKHDFGALALFSREELKLFYLKNENRITGFPRKNEDWVSRFTYAFDNRYNLEFNGAYNGTERWGPGFKFGFFPSLGLGWTVSNEKFFEGAKKVMNKLKFRYSDGKVGSNSSNNLGQWPYASTYQTGGGNIPFGSTFNLAGPAGFSEGAIANPFLQWETARKRNFGIETGFFNNKLTTELDLFRENREKILMNAGERKNVPIFFGADAPAGNIGKVISEGYELVVNYKNNINNFNYWGTFSYTYAKDEVLEREEPQFKPAYQKSQGYQIDQTTSQLSTGIINSWDEIYTGVVGLQNNNLLPGDYRILDYDANGVIDAQDAVPYGFPNRPRNTYNFMLGGDYKGFSFSMNFFGQYNITQNVALDEFAYEAPAIYPDQVNNTWLPQYGNSNPTFRALRYGLRNASNAEYTERDASLFRLKTAEIAYSLPKKAISSIGLSALRLFVNGNNLLLWTDLPVDIEGRNFSYQNYPVTKQVNFGLTATF